MFQKVINGLKTGRRWIWVLGGLILILAVIAAAISASAGTSKNDKRPETAEVTTGDLSGSITASGHVAPRQDISLAFQTSGVVKEVNVKVGDTVKAGSVLARLDDSDAQRSVKMAQNALDEANLKVQSAQTAYNADAFWRPNDKQLAAASASAANAAAAVQAAQSDYDQVQWLPWVSSTQQSLTLQQATNNYTEARANLEYLLNNRPNLTPAKINLELANLSVLDAQLALDAAQSTLKKANLVAPFDGTITVVTISAGEVPSGGAIEMITSDDLEVVLKVDEVDMASLDVNQPVSLTLDTWPDKPLTGKVLSIDPKAAPSAADSSDVVNYYVHVTIDKNDLPIRVGMTANATITVFDLKNVLLVPNSAVSQQGGKFTVTIVTASGSEKTEITIGMRNSQFTQVLSGLKAGDVVRINNPAGLTSGTATP
jgi:RND family efflux transporter MFP subunit